MKKIYVKSFASNELKEKAKQAFMYRRKMDATFIIWAEIGTSLVQVQSMKESIGALMETVLISALEYTDVLKNTIAFLSATGCTVYFYTQLDGLTVIPALSTIKPSKYSKIATKDKLYAHVDECLMTQKQAVKERQWDNQELFAKLGRVYAPLSEKELDFVLAWAPAYGVDVPKYKASSAECTSYKAQYYKDNTEEDAKRKNITEGRNYRRIATNRDMRELFDLITYMVANNFELDEGYKVCSVCGLPYRTTATTLPDGVQAEYAQCTHCETKYKVDTWTYSETAYQRVYGDFADSED